MDRKYVMLLIGIVAIGMFALPSTLAMYTGQHSFVAGADVDCDKCHGSASDAIWSEIDGGPHASLGATSPGDSCKACHGFTGLNSVGNSDKSGHAATVDVVCLNCHDDNPGVAGTIDMDSNGITITTELDTGAHKDFYDLTAATDPNLACLGCHTGAGVAGSLIADPVPTESIDLAAYTYGLNV